MSRIITVGRKKRSAMTFGAGLRKYHPTSAPAANPVDHFLELSFSAFVLLRFSPGPPRVIRDGFGDRLLCGCFGRSRRRSLNRFLEIFAHHVGAYSRRLSCPRLPLLFLYRRRRGLTVCGINGYKTVAVRRVHDFYILRDRRRRGGGIANLRILRCRDLAPLLEDRNMRGTAREEPSAQCSKQETQKDSFVPSLVALTTAAKQGWQLYFKPAMCGNPSRKTSYESCARANAQYIRARMRLWQLKLNTLTFWLFMRRSFVQTAKKHGDFNC